MALASSSGSSPFLRGDMDPEAGRFLGEVEPARLFRSGKAENRGSEEGFLGGRYEAFGRRVGLRMEVAQPAGRVSEDQKGDEMRTFEVLF